MRAACAIYYAETENETERIKLNLAEDVSSAPSYVVAYTHVINKRFSARMEMICALKKNPSVAFLPSAMPSAANYK